MSIYPTPEVGLYAPLNAAAGLYARPGEDEDQFRRFVGLGPNDPLPATPAPENGALIDVSSAATGPLDIGQPGADVKYRPNFLSRIQDRPGGREALLAFGANLLTEPNFFAGFGKGALAYQQALNAERDRGRPQLTRDQQFTYRLNPTTGQYDFQETAAGARALQLAREKLDTSETNTRYRADKAYDGKVYGVDRQYEFKDKELGYRDQWDKDRNETRIRAAEIMGQFGMDRARLQAASQAGKPPPVGALKQFDEHEGKANSADATLELGGSVMDDINKGVLDLGLLGNAHAQFSQFTGIGATESTRAYARWQQFQQILVNSILLEANGTQTNGDAVRARIMTAISSGDTAGAQREIANAMRMIERGRDYSMARANDISRQYGIDTGATGAVRNGPHPSPSRQAPAASRSGSAPAGWGTAKVKN